MWYLFLDESGDLGFDFVNKKPSKFFTICILVTNDTDSYYAVRSAIKKTLRRKINRDGKIKQIRNEIKARDTTFAAKLHFYKQVKETKFSLYAITLNKRRLFEPLTIEKERIYNYLARLVLDQIPFEKVDDQVILIVDKSKGRYEIREFNSYIVRQLQGRLDPKVVLSINHYLSESEPCLQAADLFAWGIFRKYERADKEWFEVFSGKVSYDQIYLK